MPEIEIIANGKSLKVTTDNIRIFSPDTNPGLTCIGKDDMYDLGFQPVDTKNGVTLKINGVTIEILP